MTCATCYHSVKSNLLWLWYCGYGQSLKNGEPFSLKIVLCEAGKLPEKPKWCPLPAVGREDISLKETE